MAGEVTLQVRMDTGLKEKVEVLYQDMGTSSAEAMRILTKRSIQENGMPFVVIANKRSTYGRLSKYVDIRLAAKEEGVYEGVMVEKHEKTD